MSAPIPVPRDAAQAWAAMEGEPGPVHPVLAYDRYITALNSDWKPDPARKERLFARVEEGCSLDRFAEGLSARRQNEVAALRENGYEVIDVEATQVTPLTSRLGESHALENGFMFHPLYGLPCLPGSGIKGAVRAAWTLSRCAAAGMDELNPRGLSSNEKALAETLFGTAVKGEDAKRSGAVWFLDAFPVETAGTSFVRSDVLNPHFKSYYEGNGTPSDWESPVPISFLVVPEGTRWRFTLVIDPGRLGGRIDPSAVVEEMTRALEMALRETGLGAKTSSGYGLFDPPVAPKVQKSAGETAKGGEEAWIAPKGQDWTDPVTYLKKNQQEVRGEVFRLKGRAFVQKLDKGPRKKAREAFPELFE